MATPDLDQPDAALQAACALTLLAHCGLTRAQLVALLASGAGPAALLAEGVAGWRARLGELLADCTSHSAAAGAALVAPRLEALHGCQAQVLWYGHPRYPAALGELSDPPAVLYARGDLAALEQPLLAIVGTRRPPRDMRRWVQGLAASLQAGGLVVVSGGAMGIDAAALAGCLEAGGRPVIVSGVGIDQLYPRHEAELQRRILAAGGLLLSEHLPGTPVFPGNFLARNRLIAALGRATLVAAAPVQSGSLSTATWARRLGRPVLVAPSAPWEPSGEGTRLLLRQGALAIGNAEEVRAALAGGLAPGVRPAERPRRGLVQGGGAATRGAAPGGGGSQQGARHLPGLDDPEPLLASLSDDERRVHAAIDGAGRYAEELLAATGLSLPAISASLLTLELMGLLRRVEGGRYLRVV